MDFKAAGRVMQLVRNVQQKMSCSSGIVVAIGNFDGVHVGHQQLVQAVSAYAQQHRLASAIMTFEPSPQEFFDPTHAPTRLMRWREKWDQLSQYELDFLLCYPFNQYLAELSADDFIEHLLIQHLNVKCVVVGDDFRFGAGRQGDVALLSEYAAAGHFELQVIEECDIDSERVSSSRIRALLHSGCLQRANRLLDRPYCLSGRVCYGDQRGRTWGFPTVNIPLRRIETPLTGIYAVAVVGEDFSAQGVASIGYRPVFRLQKPLLEVYLLNFDRMIYGQYLQVSFLHGLRDEMNFSDVDALIKQIKQDVVEAEAYFTRGE